MRCPVSGPHSCEVSVDHHLIAVVSILGIVLEVLGGFYLAYDLFGGERGLLRTLTRAVTYSVLFAVVYWLALGPAFGIAAGVGLGFILGVEFRDRGAVPRWRLALYGALRGLVLGVAGGLGFGVRFGALFGLIAGLGLVFSYLLLGAAPSAQYEVRPRPHLRLRPVLSGALRSLVVAAAAAATTVVQTGPGWSFVPKVFLTVWIVGVVVSTFSPAIEAWSERLPQRTLGAFGGC